MADLVIERCLPSDRAVEIKALFARAGQPGFSKVYDQVYSVREPRGLRSWIGLLGDQAVLHISVALEPFTDGTRTVTGGILGDLMADTGHRDFWSPIKLARQMVGDVKKENSAAFLLTSYVPAAEGIFRAAGFKQFCVLQRHSLPLVWAYPFLRRLLHGQRRPGLTAVPFDDRSLESSLRGLSSPGCFRPVPSEEYYATRMPRIEYPVGHWLLAGLPDSPDAAVLVSPKSTGELIIADVLWRERRSLAGLFSAVAKWGSRAGLTRLTLTTTKGSWLSSEALKAGFLLRPDNFVVMKLSLCSPDTLPPAEQWWFTPFLLTAW